MQVCFFLLDLDLDLDLPFLKRTWTGTWTCPFKVDLDLDLDLRIEDLDLDLAVAGLVTSLINAEVTGNNSVDVYYLTESSTHLLYFFCIQNFLLENLEKATFKSL